MFKLFLLQITLNKKESLGNAQEGFGKQLGNIIPKYFQYFN